MSSAELSLQVTDKAQFVSFSMLPAVVAAAAIDDVLTKIGIVSFALITRIDTLKLMTTLSTLNEMERNYHNFIELDA